MKTAAHRRRSIPWSRRLVVDSMVLGERKHVIHGLLEIDVTRARALIRASDLDLSFTAYVAASVARAIAAHPIVHAYPSMRGDLVLFDEVDVCVIVETERSDRSFPLPVVLRQADSRSVEDLTRQIRRIQRRPQEGENAPKTRWWTLIPGPLRRLLMRLAFKSPSFLRAKTGTTAVTSVGMFGHTAGFGIAYPTHYTTNLVVGSIVSKSDLTPGGAKRTRELLHLTVTFDHDIVDGGPAARFCSDLVDALESAAVLQNVATPATDALGFSGVIAQ